MASFNNSFNPYEEKIIFIIMMVDLKLTLTIIMPP